RHHARGAAGAGVEIDRHRPAVLAVRVAADADGLGLAAAALELRLERGDRVRGQLRRIPLERLGELALLRERRGQFAVHALARRVVAGVAALRALVAAGVSFGLRVAVR